VVDLSFDDAALADPERWEVSAPLLARLAAAFDRAKSAGLALQRTPCVLSAQWLHGNPYYWSKWHHQIFWEAELTVPRGTVGLTFLETGDELHWMRCRKGMHERLRLAAIELTRAGSAPMLGEADRTAHGAVPTAAPVNVTMLLPAPNLCTTGALLPLFRLDAAPVQTLAVLLLAKPDTTFCRLGLWRLHDRHSGLLPPGIARDLRNGRRGVLHAWDLDRT
jgi:hypothetical protein